MQDGNVTMTSALAALARSYDRVVLVANSESAVTVPEQPGRRTLHVFFNDARKVLAESFDGDAALVLRSGRSGPSVIRQGILQAVAGRFTAKALKALVNLQADPSEAPAGLAAHGDLPIEPLDLSGYFGRRYPGGKLPSSGYAMAVWLAESAPGIGIVLSGFDSLRSESWKVFHVHDWAFEQTALRLLGRQGRLSFHPDAPPGMGSADALQAQFPNVPVSEILAVQVGVLSERLEHTNQFVDRLWSATRLSRFARKLLQFGR